MPMRMWMIVALLAVLPSANALAVPPPDTSPVSDTDAVRLLRQAYGEPVDLRAGWRAKAGANPDPDAAQASHREICADTGGQDAGPRYIAVCGSVEDAGHAQSGIVDLWLLARAGNGPAKADPARILARERGLPSGSWGTPGKVALVDVGPGRRAFALASGYANMGWATENLSLHAERGDGFAMLFTVATHLSNSGVCDPDEDRGCRAKSISLDCAPRADVGAGADAQGFYGFTVQVRGQRAGRKVARQIAIPRGNGAYRVPAAALQRDGCDQGF